MLRVWFLCAVVDVRGVSVVCSLVSCFVGCSLHELNCVEVSKKKQMSVVVAENTPVVKLPVSGQREFKET